MSTTISIIQAGMANDMQRLQVISHNLANAGTVGFKRGVAVARPFGDMVRQATNSAIAATGSPVVRTQLDHTSGALKQTGSPLDIALEGDGYLVVSTPAGEAYTRRGSLALDVDGRLVTADGHPVLGSGGEIRLTSPEPRIDSSGAIWEGQNMAAQLRLVGVADTSTLVELGAGIYAPTASTDPSPELTLRVRQGFVEAANVNPMGEMVRMIETMRHFEASQRLARGYDDMLDRAINTLGEI